MRKEFLQRDSLARHSSETRPIVAEAMFLNHEKLMKLVVKEAMLSRISSRSQDHQSLKFFVLSQDHQGLKFFVSLQYF